MPLTTNFDVSPYFDDFDEGKNYHKILFKPSTPVQVRELNQLQTILQNQIERFGNNIYKRGTIIDGVNLQFYPDYAYIKISDNQVDGTPAFPALYVGHFARDPSTNLIAQVINSVDGYEATDPDMKTLYLRYINSGVSGNTFTFSSNSVLTIYDSDNSVNGITVNNGGSGFSNADQIAVVSALAVNVSSAIGFTNGEYLVSGNNRAIIYGIDTSYPGKTILKIQPVTADLANTSVSANTWSFPVGVSVTGNTSLAVASVTEVIGSGVKASLIADSATGAVTQVNVQARGSGYYIAPYVAIDSSGKTTPNYTNLSLTAKNMIGQVTIANSATSIGAGYAVGVSEGVIYQKGFFVKVFPQIAVVSKYSPLPNNLTVGFSTDETVIDATVDTDLLDNVIGGANGRPGADRLNLVPRIQVIASDQANTQTDFLPIVSFSAGQPYKTQDTTQFNSVETELEQRTSETQGNFVVSRFSVATRSPYAQANVASQFGIVTSPGKAYINGKRIDSKTNYVLNDTTGTDFTTANNVQLTLDFSNYLLVNELGGTFQFNTGDTVALYDTPKTYISNAAAAVIGNTTPAGTQIGTARIRSLIYDSGVVGTNMARYRLHLFNVKMNPGLNFKSTRAVAYINGATTGIADVVLIKDTTNANSSANVAKLVTGRNQLVYPITTTAGVKNISGLTYTYRTLRLNIPMGNNGILTYTFSGNTNETLSWNSPTYGKLTGSQLTEIMVIPAANVVLNNANGTASITSGSNVVTGTSTVFTQVFQVGDFFWTGNSSSNGIFRVSSITSDTALTLDRAPVFTNGTANVAKAYPMTVPIPLDRIPAANVSIDGTGTVLTVNLGAAINAASTTNCSLALNVLASNVAAQPKTPNRSVAVLISAANNVAGVNGPWCLGVPDAFRLRKVFTSGSNTVNTNSLDITSEFYIDHNQQGNYLDLSFLYKKSRSSYTVAATDWLLVQFDCYTSNPGVFNLNSYVSGNVATRLLVDSQPLSNQVTTVHSFEVPEVYTPGGQYFDLLECIDFRPVAANTVAITNVVASAPTNPPYALGFGNTLNIANERRFPLPGSAAKFNADLFMGRNDLVVINENGVVTTIKGTPTLNGQNSVPPTPAALLSLNSLAIPPYPTLPATLSQNTVDIINTGIANEKFGFTRINRKTIKTQFTQDQLIVTQPINYTMRDIGSLERRIKTLENQVAMSALESRVKNSTITSSLSPNINRFKYGFFVDNFNDGTYSDLTNPEWNAEFLNGRVCPPSLDVLVTHGGNTYITAPIQREYTLIDQSGATGTINPSNGGVVTATVDRISPNVLALGGPILTGNHYPDSVTVNMSSGNSGVQTCTLYLYNYSSGDRMDIYKNQAGAYMNADGTMTNATLVASTENAVALTAADVTYMSSQPLFSDVVANLTTTLRTKTQVQPYQLGWLVLYGAKIVFQHNPATGSSYTIVVRKGPQSGSWKWQLSYPVDSSSAGNLNKPRPVPSVAPDLNIYTEFPYTRAFYDQAAPLTQPLVVQPVVSGPTLYAGVATVTGVLNKNGSVTVDIRGLKPLTNHHLIVDPTSATLNNLALDDHTYSVTQPSTPLLSDANGKLSFVLSGSILPAAWGSQAGTGAWGNQGATGAWGVGATFSDMVALSYPTQNRLPLLINGGQNLGLGPTGTYVFGTSFAYFNVQWSDYTTPDVPYTPTTTIITQPAPPAPVVIAPTSNTTANVVSSVPTTVDWIYTPPPSNVTTVPVEPVWSSNINSVTYTYKDKTTTASTGPTTGGAKGPQSGRDDPSYNVR